ncbi:MAG: DUF1272 domain-containing protein [Pseudomonadota bacterium]
MLELRPNCELCDCDLPPDSEVARICSYECTYCKDCVEDVLSNVCPTCGGGFQPRPIRPVAAEGLQTDLGLENRPAGLKRHHSCWSPEEIDTVRSRLKHVPPNKR